VVVLIVYFVDECVITVMKLINLVFCITFIFLLTGLLKNS